ncbi:hypothetical protein EV363DRAFT_1403099 [Boletus edulis]|nr:hypothetical protein EV363DRAFT_1403099 [Boletus edulis]
MWSVAQGMTFDQFSIDDIADRAGHPTESILPDNRGPRGIPTSRLECSAASTACRVQRFTSEATRLPDNHQWLQ